jgi:hypothetical protein
MNEMDAKFQVAVDFIASRGGNRLSNEQVAQHGRYRPRRALATAGSRTNPAVDDRMDDFVDVQRLTLYAFYKQAHFGKCTIDKPSAADFVGSAKW